VSSVGSFGAVQVFVSYSHQDNFWVQRLMPLLRGLPGSEVKAWNDKDIGPGEPWDKKIKDALQVMDVFIALVSTNFGVSQYIREVELPEAKRRHDKNEIDVLPVYLGEPADGDCDWLNGLQRVPPKAWSEIYMELPEYDRALKPIREGIRAVVKRALDRKFAGRP
jgi:hypothetical protein